MAYSNQIPRPADLLSDSQDDLLQNFNNVQALVDVNHVDFALAGQGKHNFLEIPTYANIPNPLANEIVIQSTQALTNQTELVYQSPNFPAGTISFMTAKRTPMPQVGSSWAFLGGTRLLMKWGYASFAGFGVLAFPQDPNGTIPQFVAPPYIIQVSVIGIPVGDNNTAVRTVSKTNVSFTVYCSQRTVVGPAETSFFYLAIGRA